MEQDSATVVNRSMGIAAGTEISKSQKQLYSFSRISANAQETENSQKQYKYEDHQVVLSQNSNQEENKQRVKSANRISNRHKRRNHLQKQGLDQSNQRVNQTVIEEFKNERHHNKQLLSSSSKSKLSRKAGLHSNQDQTSLNDSLLSTQKMGNRISNFDRLEEARLKAYEIQQKLNYLLVLIEDQSQQSTRPFTLNEIKYQLVQATVWEQIKSQAQMMQNQYRSSTQQWDDLASDLATDIDKYRSRCRSLRENIQLVKTQCFQEVNAEFHQSLRDIDTVYEKNRTQMFTMIDQISTKFTDGFKQARQELNHEHSGTIKMVEREIEDVYDYFTQSGRLSMKDKPSVDRHSSLKQRHFQQQQEQENSTPRSQIQQQLSQRGRSQPQQQKSNQSADNLQVNMSGVNTSSQISDSNSKPNIPRLPIHMINSQRKEGGQVSNRNSMPPLPPTIQSERANSQRGPNSQRGKTSARGGQPFNYGSNILGNIGLSNYNSNTSNQQQPHNLQTGREMDSRRSDLSENGQAAVMQAMANPVIQGAAKLDSKFEKDLEDDFPDAEQTMEFDTERLKDYPEAYDMLMNMDPDSEQRIVAKQVVFLQYEREIKKQIKKEKQEKKLRKQLHHKNNNNNNNNNSGATPRNHQINPTYVSSHKNDSLKDSSVESDAKVVKRLHSQNSSLLNGGHMNQTLNNSIISLQQQLPSLGTIDRAFAHEKQSYNYNDVKLDELLKVPNEFDFMLKTATEKEIILRINKEYEYKEQIKKQERRALPSWSDDEESKSQPDIFADYNSNPNQVRLSNIEIHSSNYNSNSRSDESQKQQHNHHKSIPSQQNLNINLSVLSSQGAQSNSNNIPRKSNGSNNNSNQNNTNLSTNKKSYNNGAIHIVDNKNAQVNSQQYLNDSQKNPYGEGHQVSSESFSPGSSSMIEQSIIQKEDQSQDQNQSYLPSQSMTQSVILDTPVMDNEDEEQINEGDDDEYEVSNYNMQHPSHKQNGKYDSNNYMSQRPGTHYSNQSNSNNNYQQQNTQSNLRPRKTKLEVITEKQSEFSSSMNTNTNKNGGGQSQRSLIKNIEGKGSDPQMYRVQSARDTPCSKNVEFNRLQYILPYQEILTNRSSSKQKEQETAQEAVSRPKSHRQQNSHPNRDISKVDSNMPLPKKQSQLKRQKSERNQQEELKVAGLPNQSSMLFNAEQPSKSSVRQIQQQNFVSQNQQQVNQNQMQSKGQAFNYFNKNELQHLNNFMSIQLDDEAPSHLPSLFNLEDNLNLQQQLQLTQLSQQLNQKLSLGGDKNDSMNLNMHQYNMYKKMRQQQNNPQSQLREEPIQMGQESAANLVQYMNQFSSIQNHFEESRASSFMNESFEETKTQDRQLFRTRSQVLIRTKTDLYDLEDAFDINNINLEIEIPKEETPSKGLGAARQKDESKIRKGIDSNNFNMFSPKALHEESGNINSTQNNLNAGSGMVMLNSNRLAMLLQNPQMTALLNFLQNQTQAKVALGNGTREVTTCKRLNVNNATNCNSIFTLSTYTEDTLSQQLIPIQRRTIQMLQNFHNNYYNNHAGVLFTLPGGVNGLGGLANGTAAVGGVANSSGVLNAMGGGTIPHGTQINNNVGTVGHPTGYLQQCSTVPSEPGLSSGKCMTLQAIKSGKQNQFIQNSQNQNQSSQPIFIQNQQQSLNQFSSNSNVSIQKQLQQQIKFNQKIQMQPSSVQTQNQSLVSQQIQQNYSSMNQSEASCNDSIIKNIIRNRSQSSNKKFDLSKIKISKNIIMKAGQQAQSQQQVIPGSTSVNQSFVGSVSSNISQQIPQTSAKSQMSQSFLSPHQPSQLSPYHLYNSIQPQNPSTSIPQQNKQGSLNISNVSSNQNALSGLNAKLRNYQQQQLQNQAQRQNNRNL